MKLLKKFFLILLIVLSTLTIASCKKKNKDDKGNVEEGATKITVYAREFEQWAKEHLQGLVDEFNTNLEDGIQVNVKFYTQDTYADALTVARETPSIALAPNLPLL